MKKIILMITIVISIAGCAIQQQKKWYKDGSNEETFRRDRMTCHQVGMQSAQANGLSGNLFVQSWINDEASKCLKNLGYKQQE